MTWSSRQQTARQYVRRHGFWYDGTW